MNSGMNIDNIIWLGFFCHNHMLKKTTSIWVDNIINRYHKPQLKDDTVEQSIHDMMSKTDNGGYRII